MPDNNIFCNTPWYELHIYWDGSLGICCQESHKLYADQDTQYNIATMSIAEWFNSEPVRKFRQAILKDQRLSLCRRCYFEEDHGGDSRRLRSNQKSVIFTRTSFDESFRQSPGYTGFQYSEQNQGYTITHPIDLHIDLGNYCNLACKMCGPNASSTIATQEVKWGIESSRKFLGSDWTHDHNTWNNFKKQVIAIPKVNNIHFMGGETLLTDRLEDFVDTMIEHKKFDLCFSFVTNGTIFKPELIEKFKLFRRVGFEISIESIDEHNAYQRQGTDTKMVLENIQKYQTACNGSSVTVTLRPAPSILTIGYMDSLLQYALDHQFIVKSNVCYKPKFLNIVNLPSKIKNQYKKKYVKILEQLEDVVAVKDYNASDINNYRMIVKEHAEMCVNLLSTPSPADADQQLELMVRHCERWDRKYNLNARQLYPEWQSILDQYDYQI